MPVANDPNRPSRRVVRTPQAAEYTSLSASTLEKLRLSGGGPKFIKLGSRAVGYEIAELDRWLEECAAAGE